MKKALAGAFAGASLLAALALALAACGGSGGSGGSGGYGSPAPTTTAAPKTAGVEVTVASAKLGMILADAKGRTLYVFLKDKGDQSACAGACASTWPALTVTGSAAPTAGSGVDGSKLATSKQAGGSTQVTYGGHLLYYFAGDSAAGQTNGQGIGGIWFVVGPAGAPIMAKQ